MTERSYEGLDEALVPLHQYLQMLMPMVDTMPGVDAGGKGGIRIEQIELSMPIEIDILTESSGEVSVGLSPPLYYVETGFEPVGHRVRVTIVEEAVEEPVEKR